MQRQGPESLPIDFDDTVARVVSGRGERALRFLRRTGELFGSLALTFLGLTCVTFFIGRFIPVDPVLAVVGDRATRDVYEKAKIEMGLDKPIPMQFLIYLKKILGGDLGHSVITSHPSSPIYCISSPRPSNWQRWQPLLDFPRVPAGVVAGAPKRPLAGPSGSSIWPLRLFNAGVLARTCRLVHILWQTQLGCRPRTN